MKKQGGLSSILFVSACCIVVIIFCACAGKVTTDKPVGGIPYPHPRPDSTALPFLPAIVSGNGLDFGSAFSPDGQSFYFSRSENKKLTIYVSHYDGKNWAAPVPAACNDPLYSQADAAFGPDGRFYFISNRPKSPQDTLPDFDIWFTTVTGDGRWSKPENLKSLNTDSSEFYISFAKNGNLYFASSREGGFGEEDIYVSRLVNGTYTLPENIGATVNTSKSEYDPAIDASEGLLVFTSSNREDGFGAGDLYYTNRSDQKWRQAVNLGKNINTATREYCPYFSPDADYFFYSSEGDVKWMGRRGLEKQINKPDKK